jgi:hypothetical protein
MRTGLASVWERSAATTVALSGRAAEWALATGKRLLTSADSLGDRTADSVTTYVMPAVRSRFGGDGERGMESGFRTTRQRVPHH